MPEVGCSQAMELLNLVFTSPLILNDGHEVHDRLARGDRVVDIVEELVERFGDPASADNIQRVTEGWPGLHMEAVAGMVQWALSKLDTNDRVTIHWKGDASYHETVTRFEIRARDLYIEFLHPPGEAVEAEA